MRIDKVEAIWNIVILFLGSGLTAAPRSRCRRIRLVFLSGDKLERELWKKMWDVVNNDRLTRAVP
jgi:hypothetical protein